MSSSYYGNVATGGWSAPAMPHQDQFYVHQNKYGGYSESQSYYNHQYHQAAAAAVAAVSTTPSPPFRYPPSYPQTGVQCNAVRHHQSVPTCTPPVQATPSPSASSSPASRTSYSPSASGSPVSAFDDPAYNNGFGHHQMAPFQQQQINTLEPQQQQPQQQPIVHQKLSPPVQSVQTETMTFNNLNAYDIHQRGYQNAGVLHQNGAGYCVKNAGANYFPNWMQAYAGKNGRHFESFLCFFCFVFSTGSRHEKRFMNKERACVRGARVVPREKDECCASGTRERRTTESEMPITSSTFFLLVSARNRWRAREYDRARQATAHLALGKGLPICFPSLSIANWRPTVITE